MAEKSWAELASEEFACKPSSRCERDVVRVVQGRNLSLECGVTGSPVPAVRWVRAGRILANLSTPPLSNVPELKYIILQTSTLSGKMPH